MVSGIILLEKPTSIWDRISSTLHSMAECKDSCSISLMDHIEHLAMITVIFLFILAFGYFPRPVYEYDDSKELITPEPIQKKK
jgi:hypothetical protein